MSKRSRDLRSADLVWPENSRRRSDQTIQEILALIRNGQLKPGNRMPPERELVARLSISRSSLREAIRTLETMGVLRVVPGRGTWVQGDGEGESSRDGWFRWLPDHHRDVMDLLEMRETLEIKATALAAERGTGEQLEQLRAEHQRMKDACGAGDRDEIVAADAALHDAIAVGSGNRILTDVLTGLRNLAVESRRAIMSIPGRPGRSVAEHEAIVEAVLARNPTAAARAMFEHVRRAQEETAAAAQVVTHYSPGARDGVGADGGG